MTIFKTLKSLSKIILLGLLFFVFLISSKKSFAATTSALLPQNDGFYTQFTPKSGATHYTMVDESTCNGTTDYNNETTVGQRDSYGVNLSSVPDNATITGISITPCASKNSSGGSNTTFDVFYRLDGVDSADMPGYMLSTTTPSVLSATNYSGLSVTKTGSTILEIGGVYTAGNKGLRISQMSVVVTYSVPPSTTTSAATSIGTNSATLNSIVNPNGSSTTVWYRYGTSNVSCNSLPTATSSINIGSGSADVSPNARIASPLTGATTYYFCAVAVNSGGTTYGTVLQFTTL